MYLVFPAGAVEEPILATAGPAGRRSCRQSPSGHLFKEGAPTIVGEFSSVCLRSPCCPVGLQRVQDLTPVLAPLLSSLYALGDQVSASLGDCMFIC